MSARQRTTNIDIFYTESVDLFLVIESDSSFCTKEYKSTSPTSFLQGVGYCLYSSLNVFAVRLSKLPCNPLSLSNIYTGIKFFSLRMMMYFFNRDVFPDQSSPIITSLSPSVKFLIKSSERHLICLSFSLSKNDKSGYMKISSNFTFLLLYSVFQSVKQHLLKKLKTAN